MPIVFFRITKRYAELDEMLSTLALMTGNIADQSLYISFSFRGRKTFLRVIFGIIVYLLLNVVNFLMVKASKFGTFGGYITTFQDPNQLIFTLQSPEFLSSILEGVSYGLVYLACKDFFSTSFGFKSVFYPVYYLQSLGSWNLLRNIGQRAKSGIGRIYSKDDLFKVFDHNISVGHHAPLTVLVTGILTFNLEYEAFLCNAFFHVMGPLIGAFMYQFGEPLFTFCYRFDLGEKDIVLIFLFFWFVFYSTYIVEWNLRVSLRGDTLNTGIFLDNVVYPRKQTKRKGESKGNRKKKNKNKGKSGK